MSDRKYRQRGYQDEPRSREPQRATPKPQEPHAPGRPLQSANGPKTPNLMGSHEVFRCARCGHRLSLEVTPDERCEGCGVDLHSCVQCSSFDTGSRFECAQPGVTARIAPKDTRNACAWFSPRTTVERQTGTPGPTGNSARQAFDDLFK